MMGRTVTVRGTEIMFVERGSAWSQRDFKGTYEVEVTDSKLLAELNGLSAKSSTSETIMMNGTRHRVIVSIVSSRPD